MKIFINLNTRKTSFTLIELLVVIGIMVIIAGIGVKGYKRMAGEMALNMTEGQIRQLVSATVSEARKHKIPMQIQVSIPENPQTEACRISGGSGSLVAYFGFDQTDPGDGMGPIDLNNVTSDDGFYGKGALCDGNRFNTEEFSTLNFYKNVYVEAMLKPDFDQQLTQGNGVEVIEGHDTFSIGFVADNGNLKIVAGNSTRQAGAFIESEIPFPDDDQWHKIGAMRMHRNETEVYAAIYLDGALIKDGIISHSRAVGGTQDTLRPQRLWVGQQYYGLIDEIKVFSIGVAQQVTLDPRDTYLFVNENGIPVVDNMAMHINISPIGTVRNDFAIQVISTRLNGSLEADPAVGDAEKIRKIRSTVPKSGYLSFDGSLVKYEWGGADEMKINKIEVNGTDPAATSAFNYTKPVFIKKDGSVQ